MYIRQSIPSMCGTPVTQRLECCARARKCNHATMQPSSYAKHANTVIPLPLQLRLGLALLRKCLLIAVIQMLSKRFYSLRALQLQSAYR